MTVSDRRFVGFLLLALAATFVKWLNTEFTGYLAGAAVAAGIVLLTWDTITFTSRHAGWCIMIGVLLASRISSEIVFQAWLFGIFMSGVSLVCIPAFKSKSGS